MYLLRYTLAKRDCKKHENELCVYANVERGEIVGCVSRRFALRRVLVMGVALLGHLGTLEYLDNKEI